MVRLAGGDRERDSAGEGAAKWLGRQLLSSFKISVTLIK
jgi:hypothetical protein